MAFKAKEIASKLETKFAFTKAQNKSDDHLWYELEIEGVPKVMTKLSHGNTPVTLKIEGLIAKQIGVRGQFFKGMISCTHSKDDYYNQLRIDPVGTVLALRDRLNMLNSDGSAEIGETEK